MDIEEMKKEILEKMDENNECRVKSQVKAIIQNIVGQQKIVAEAVKVIAENQKLLKEISLPDKINCDGIFGQ